MDNFSEGGVEQQFFVADLNRKRELDSLVEERESERVKDKFKEDPNGKPHDGRSLWEQLEANKATKQAELDEKYKFRVYTGLDEDESGFLSEVSQAAALKEEKRILEDMEQVRSFRKMAALKKADAAAAGVNLKSDRQDISKRGRLLNGGKQTGRKGKSQSLLLAQANMKIRQKSLTSETEKRSPGPTPAGPDEHSRHGNKVSSGTNSAARPPQQPRKQLVLGYVSSDDDDDDEQ